MPPINTEDLYKVLDYWFKQSSKEEKKNKYEYIIKRIYLTVYAKEKDVLSLSKNKPLRNEAIKAYNNIDKNTEIFSCSKNIAYIYKNVLGTKPKTGLNSELKKLLQQGHIIEYIEKNNITLPSTIDVNNDEMIKIKSAHTKKEKQRTMTPLSELLEILIEKSGIVAKKIENNVLSMEEKYSEIRKFILKDCLANQENNDGLTYFFDRVISQIGWSHLDWDSKEDVDMPKKQEWLTNALFGWFQALNNQFVSQKIINLGTTIRETKNVDELKKMLLVLRDNGEKLRKYVNQSKLEFNGYIVKINNLKKQIGDNMSIETDKQASLKKIDEIKKNYILFGPTKSTIEEIQKFESNIS